MLIPAAKAMWKNPGLVLVKQASSFMLNWGLLTKLGFDVSSVQAWRCLLFTESIKLQVIVTNCYYILVLMPILHISFDANEGLS